MAESETPKEPTPWERFRAATKRVLSVSKEDLNRREQRWRKWRAAKRKPKPI